MRRSLAVPSLAALLVAAGCQSAPQFTDQDATKLRGMFDNTATNLSANNYAEWAKEFTDDATFQPANGKPLRGRAAIQAWGQANPKIEQLTFGNVQVSGDGNMAFGTSSYALKMTGVPADTGKQLVVFKRGADGNWMVQAVSFNSDLPMPMAAPSKTPSKAAPSKAPARAPRKTKHD